MRPSYEEMRRIVMSLLKMGPTWRMQRSDVADALSHAALTHLIVSLCRCPGSARPWKRGVM